MAVSPGCENDASKSGVRDCCEQVAGAACEDRDIYLSEILRNGGVLTVDEKTELWPKVASYRLEPCSMKERIFYDARKRLERSFDWGSRKAVPKA